MSEIQFEVITDLTTINPQHIDTNFQEVREWLKRELEPYSSLVVTEDTVSSGKAARARIRKLRDSINAQKVAVKRQWLKPFDKYEEECKALISLCDEAAENIDSQCKAFEQEKKAKKLAELEEYYLTRAKEADVERFMAFADISNPRWTNATYKLETAKEEINAAVEKTADDIDFIRGLHSDYAAAMLDEYSRSLDLKKALAREKAMKDMQKMEEQRKAAAIASSFEEPKAETAQSDPQIIIAENPVIRPMGSMETPVEKKYFLRFEVEVTADQARSLKAFFNDEGIKYKKI